MKRLLQLLILTPLLLGAGRIINGVPVTKRDPNYWKTVRLLSKTFNGKYVPACTGTIIGPDLILLAAHCVESVSVEETLIGYEVQPLTIANQQNSKTAVDVSSRFKTSRVLNWMVHPKYGTVDYDHDIAVIQIEGHIPEGFQPATILPKVLMDQILMGKGFSYKLEILGYGLTNDSPWTESEILRRTEVEAYFEGLHVITDQSKGSGGCHGDSGGPAYLEIKGTLYLVGVTHGPTTDSLGCKQKGVWVNPALETEFLNDAAGSFGSEIRF